MAFRVLQGIGAAVLVPASLALVVEGFDAARRAHGVGLWGAAAAIASGLGPPIGGAIVRGVELAVGVPGEPAAGCRGGGGGPARTGREPRPGTAARTRPTRGGAVRRRARAADARVDQRPGLGLGQRRGRRVVPSRRGRARRVRAEFADPIRRR